MSSCFGVDDDVGGGGGAGARFFRGVVSVPVLPILLSGVALIEELSIDGLPEEEANEGEEDPVPGVRFSNGTGMSGALDFLRRCTVIDGGPLSRLDAKETFELLNRLLDISELSSELIESL